tara:strand:- start:87 stop:944 length:858 start_codon:yes stop_codon:yes gene_type:complete
MIRNRPNFFLIGAAKSGTTAIYSLLGQHPEIFLSVPKEPAFFCENVNWTKGISWYENLFANAGTAKVIGEGSTYYTLRPSFDHVVKKIAFHCPKSKFLYVVRDPIERTISHYWYAVQRHMESRGMTDAILANPHYLETSDYAYQIAPYLEAFGRDRILVVSFESFILNPRIALQEIYRWLEVDPNFEPSATETKLNVGQKELVQIKGQGKLYKFSKGRTWRTISPIVPSLIKDLGRFFAIRNVERSSKDRLATENYLRPLLLDKTKSFVEILGQEFPEWKTLYRQ